MNKQEDLWKVVQAVATEDTTYEDDFGNIWCVFCHGEQSYSLGEYQHQDSCPVEIAKRLLAEKEQER